MFFGFFGGICLVIELASQVFDFFAWRETRAIPEAHPTGIPKANGFTFFFVEFHAVLVSFIFEHF